MGQHRTGKVRCCTQFLPPPYLSGAGRLVLKDVLMLAGSVLMIADSAKQIVNSTSLVNPKNERVSG
ncbi:DUF417 family protein [Pseudomonas sp. PCH44]|nr:DUF417 family protein [Pseudomonas sp. PCH44]